MSLASLKASAEGIANFDFKNAVTNSANLAHDISVLKPQHWERVVTPLLKAIDRHNDRVIHHFDLDRVLPMDIHPPTVNDEWVRVFFKDSWHPTDLDTPAKHKATKSNGHDYVREFVSFYKSRSKLRIIQEGAPAPGTVANCAVFVFILGQVFELESLLKGTS